MEKLSKKRANLPSCQGIGEKYRASERESEIAIQEAIKTQLPVILREIAKC